jgi:hypothetical protein
MALFLAYHTRLNQPLSVRKLIDHLASVLGDPPGAQTAPPVVKRTPPPPATASGHAPHLLAA